MAEPETSVVTEAAEAVGATTMNAEVATTGLVAAEAAIMAVLEAAMADPQWAVMMRSTTCIDIMAVVASGAERLMSNNHIEESILVRVIEAEAPKEVDIEVVMIDHIEVGIDHSEVEIDHPSEEVRIDLSEVVKIDHSEVEKIELSEEDSEVAMIDHLEVVRIVLSEEALEVAMTGHSEVARIGPSEVAKLDLSEEVRTDLSEVARTDLSEVTKKEFSEVEKSDPLEEAKIDPSEVARIDPSEVAEVNLEVARIDLIEVEENSEVAAVTSEVVRIDLSSEVVKTDPSEGVKIDPLSEVVRTDPSEAEVNSEVDLEVADQISKIDKVANSVNNVSMTDLEDSSWMILLLA